jgi:PIN domain nuclease of toxin-antitoxin system
MSGYLLDTHSAIWFFNGDESLSQTANNIIRDLSNDVYISMTSAWELAIKIGIGKLDFAGKTAGFIRLAEKNKITLIPITTSHLTVLESLPMIHRDPFDRLLVATAIAEQMTLITADANIARYDVSQIW